MRPRFAVAARPMPVRGAPAAGLKNSALLGVSLGLLSLVGACGRQPENTASVWLGWDTSLAGKRSLAVDVTAGTEQSIFCVAITRSQSRIYLRDGLRAGPATVSVQGHASADCSGPPSGAQTALVAELAGELQTLLSVSQSADRLEVSVRPVARAELETRPEQVDLQISCNDNEPCGPCSRCAEGVCVQERNGASCGHSLVCLDGACLPCADGQVCTPPGTVCRKGKISCATGRPLCQDTGRAREGSACAPAKKCKRGRCR